MEKQSNHQREAMANRYRRPQNIRVVLSSYLTELRENQYKRKAAVAS